MSIITCTDHSVAPLTVKISCILHVLLTPTAYARVAVLPPNTVTCTCNHVPLHLNAGVNVTSGAVVLKALTRDPLMYLHCIPHGTGNGQW